MNLLNDGTTRMGRRTICAAAAVFLVTVLAGCTRQQQVHQLGDKVQVGGVLYSVIDAEWVNELNSGGGLPRTPQHRFLVVQLSMSNVGNKETTLPLLHVVKPDNTELLELSEGQGIESWLGILRTLNPTETKVGRIVFDVPQGAYNLRLTDGGDPDTEKTAVVALPAKSKGGMDSPLLNTPANR
ncbi:MAG: DUF4352 domain-containing protein [Bryobacterales bacterium]|nr:DUF4352 domain-containing protein [Bryobacterales bacterium]